MSVDGASYLSSIALFCEDKASFYQFNEVNVISRSLIKTIDTVIASLDIDIHKIDYFVTNLGPGSFTGVRVAMAALQAFELITNKPFYGINIFDAIAICNRSLISSHSKIRIVIKCDASNFYSQYFDCHGSSLSKIERMDQDILSGVNDDLILTNMKNIIVDSIVVDADAKTIANALRWKLLQNSVSDDMYPTPVYVY